MSRPLGYKNKPKNIVLKPQDCHVFKTPETSIETILNWQIEKQIALMVSLYDSKDFKQFDICQRTLLDQLKFANELITAKKGYNVKLDLNVWMEKLGIKTDKKK